MSFSESFERTSSRILQMDWLNRPTSNLVRADQGHSRTDIEDLGVFRCHGSYAMLEGQGQQLAIPWKVQIVPFLPNDCIPVRISSGRQCHLDPRGCLHLTMSMYCWWEFLG